MTPSKGPEGQADVETTNWNAVKMLASQYGINLRRSGEASRTDEANDASSISVPIPETSTSSSEGDTVDLGIGTPFHITARRVEGGRIIYRFKSRAAAGTSQSEDNALQSRAKIGSSDTLTARGSPAESPRSKALKASRSIPAIRTNQSSQRASPKSTRNATLARNQRQDDSRRNALRPEGTAKQVHVYGGAGSLESGDVLGAILGLRTGQSGKPRLESTQRQARQAGSSSTNRGGRRSLSPQHTFARAQAASPQSAPTILAAETVTAPFGDGVMLPPARALGLASRRHTPSAVAGPSSRPDVSVQAQTRSVDDKIDNPSTFLHAESPASVGRLHPPGLREMQSFESGGSMSTEKATWQSSDSQDKPKLEKLESRDMQDTSGNRITSFPAAIRPHLRRLIDDNGNICDDGTLIFDILQHYSQYPAEARSDDSSSHTREDSDSRSSSSAYTRTSSSRTSGSDIEYDARRSSGKQPSAANRRSTSRDQNGATNAERSLLSSIPPNVPQKYPSPLPPSAQATSALGAPGDDPRFALWATRSGGADGPLVLSSRAGGVDLGLPAPAADFAPHGRAESSGSTFREGDSNPISSGEQSATGKDANGARTKHNRPPGDDARDSVLFPVGRAAMIAATATRIVAEITSEIDARLMTDFFYTYRIYLAPRDLLRLLTLRFQWALTPPVTPADEARRRIVRVRTYTVIKYWLARYFDFDFLPDRELRSDLTTWLNDLSKHPTLPDRPADMSIVKSLKKVVRGLKSSYTMSGVGGLLATDIGRIEASSTSSPRQRSHTSGSTVLNHESRVEGFLLQDPLEYPKISDDVDLDFEDPDDANVSPSAVASQDSAIAALTGHLHGADPVDVSGGSTTHAALPAASADMSAGTLTVQAPPPPLPQSHNAISRVFVSTVGRLARFKRVLGTVKSPFPFPYPSGTDAALMEDLEFEANDSGDLLFIKGGLENFMRAFNFPPIESSGDRIDYDVESDQNSLYGGRYIEEQAEAEEKAEENFLDQSTDDDHGTTASVRTSAQETPSLSANDSAISHSTPSSSLDLAEEQEHLSAMEAAETDRFTELSSNEYAQPMMALDETNLRALQDMTASNELHHGPLRKPHTDHLHHTTSEQTLRIAASADSLAHEAPDPKTVPSQSAGMPAVTTPETAPEGETSKSASVSLRTSAPAPATAKAEAASDGGPDRDVVQIDDIDLSSDEDDGVVRRALRRLPGARDLRMANMVQIRAEPTGRSSFDTLSNVSLGRGYAAYTSHASVSGFSIVSQGGVGMAPQDDGASTPPLVNPIIGVVQTDLFDPDEALEGYEMVRGFRLDGLDSDDDEPGDVEAALRRLEGVIDENKQREKGLRVEAMWQRAIIRKAGGDAASATDRRTSALRNDESNQRASRTRSFSVNDSELLNSGEDAGTFSQHPPAVSLSDEALAGIPATSPQSRAHSVAIFDQSNAADTRQQGALPGGPRRNDQRLRATAGVPSQSANGAKRRVSHAGGFHNAQARDKLRAQVNADERARTLDRAVASSKFGLWALPPVHRSFLLGYRSETIAQQLCLIEIDLFKAVRWDELVSDRWKERSFSHGEVTDWEVFYQAKGREKTEAVQRGEPHRARAVESIVARFNLTCNWVASEIVLTQGLDERAAVVAKLIRVAWKAYQQSNFATLTQIMLGLQSPWVERLHKTWARIGMWEMRILRDLKLFTSPNRNFRHLRNAMQSVIAHNSMDDPTMGAPPSRTTRSVGPISATQRSKNKPDVHISDGCVPFFGLFIADLVANDALPAYIDPSAPASPVQLDNKGALVRLASPDAFDDLPLLPEPVRYEPLVNLYKHRLTALTVKTVLAFQERAKTYQYEADGSIYVKCFKIRCLTGEQLTQISHAAEA